MVCVLRAIFSKTGALLTSRISEKINTGSRASSCGINRNSRRVWLTETKIESDLFFMVSLWCSVCKLGRYFPTLSSRCEWVFLWLVMVSIIHRVFCFLCLVSLINNWKYFNYIIKVFSIINETDETQKTKYSMNYWDHNKSQKNSLTTRR